MAPADPGSMASSAEIFSSSHTLAQIRGLHRTLHAQVDEKKARLRTQVGGSYRELLGTADAIVGMRADNDDVRRLLAGMGARCGRAVVGAKVVGMAGFAEKRIVAEVEGEEAGAAAAGVLGQVARGGMLEQCAVVLGRLLRGLRGGDGVGGKLLLATKVLILGRLLVKSFEGAEIADDEVEEMVESSDKALMRLRRQLVGCIEWLLERESTVEDEPGHDGDDDHEHDHKAQARRSQEILRALCAYSLATSSGAKDVLRYFLRVREEAMKRAFGGEEGEAERGGGAEDVTRGLKLYTRTLLQVQDLAPLRLTEALGELRSQPLTADAELKRLETLRLDVYERWCGDEIEYFKPFIRHDDLDGGQAREMLGGWAQRGSRLLVDGLGRSLGRMHEFKVVVELRTRLLSLWIRDSGRLRGFDASEMLSSLRATMLDHLLRLVSTKTRKLRLVGSEIKSTLSAESPLPSAPGLWDVSSYDMSLSNGAAHFLHDVLSRLHGRSDAVSRAVKAYGSWKHVVSDVRAVVADLEKQRWENDADDEIEDEETIEERTRMLSREDPRTVAAKLDEELAAALGELEGAAEEAWREHGRGARRGEVARFLLRVLRDIRADLPDPEGMQMQMQAQMQGWGLGLVRPMHEALAETVAGGAVEGFAAAALEGRRLLVRSLWEGEPALPTQPSPGAFLLLRALSRAMADAGTDLWSPSAVGRLKDWMGGRLCERWKGVLDVEVDVNADGKAGEVEGDGESKEQGEGEARPGKDDDEARADAESQETDLMIQWAFDVLYLKLFVASSDGRFDELEDEVFRRTGLDAPLRQKMVKSSHEYFKRTSLLFGMLAGEQKH